MACYPLPLVARQVSVSVPSSSHYEAERIEECGGSPALARWRAAHVAPPVGDRVHQALLAQYRHRAPRGRPRDLELLDDLALGRYSRIRPVLASPNPPPDDLRYLPVRGNRGNRVNPVSVPICHRYNSSCMRLTSYVCGQGHTSSDKLRGSAGSFGHPVRVSVSRDPVGAGFSRTAAGSSRSRTRVNDDAARR
jgi:hypothetical protein